MANVPLMMGLLDPLYSLFGWIMTNMYAWIGSYGLVVIIFTILLRAILIPFGIKSQKGMLLQQALQDDINEIKRVYAKDPQKQQQMQMQLMRENGVSTMAGCLTSLLQFAIIIPVITIFQRPMHYIAGVATENLGKIGDFLAGQNYFTEAQLATLARTDIPVLTALKEHASALGTSVEQGWIKLSQVIDLDFLGIDLGMKPSWRPADLFGDQWRVYLPLLIFPILTMLTMWLQMRLMRVSMPKQISKEEREREKRNPAKAGQTPKDPTAGMMRSMNIIMPLFMLWTMFSMPSAMGLYWVMGNIMGIIQSLLIYYFYTKPFRAAIQSGEQVYDKRRKADD